MRYLLGVVIAALLAGPALAGAERAWTAEGNVNVSRPHQANVFTPRDCAVAEVAMAWYRDTIRRSRFFRDPDVKEIRYDLSTALIAPRPAPWTAMTYKMNLGYTRSDMEELRQLLVLIDTPLYKRYRIGGRRVSSTP